MISPGLAALLVLAVCAPLSAPILGQQMLFLSDVLRQHYAFQTILNRLLAEAPWRLPRWDPYMFCGHPLLADPQFQAYYPPAILYRILPFPMAFGLFLALHLVIAAIGMAIFVRRMGVSPRAAAIAALAFTLGAHPAELLTAPPVLCAYAWLPWIGVFADRVAAGGGVRAAAGFGIAFAWLALTGYPPYLLYAAVLAVVVMACRGRPAGWWRPAVLAAIVAVAAAAAVLIPFAAYLPDTIRGRPFAPAQATGGAMALWGFLSFLVPLGFLPVTEEPVLGAPGLWTSLHYVGAIPLALAVTAVAIRPRGRPLKAPLILVAIGLALGLGRQLPVVGPLLLAVPPLSFLRHPGLWAALAGFGAAWLAGIGADEVERRLSGREGRRIMEGWAVAVVFLGSVWIGSKIWKFGLPHQMLADARWGVHALVFAARMGNVWYPAGMIGLGLVLLWLAARREIGIRSALVALAFFTWVDCAYVLTVLQPVGRSGWLMQPSPTEKWFAGSVKPGTWGRVLVTMRLEERGLDEGEGRENLLRNMRAAFRTNLPAAAGLRQASGNDPLRPATDAYLDTAQMFPVMPWQPKAVEVLDRLGVRWLITTTRLKPDGLRKVFDGYVDIWERTGRHLIPAWVEPRGAGAVRSAISHRPGEWDIDLDVRGPALLTVSESWVRGWRVEGAPAGIRPGAGPGGLIGVPLPAGSYRPLRLVYEPWSVPAGLWLSFAAFAALLVAAFVRPRSARR